MDRNRDTLNSRDQFAKMASATIYQFPPGRTREARNRAVINGLTAAVLSDPETVAAEHCLRLREGCDPVGIVICQAGGVEWIISLQTCRAVSEALEQQAGDASAVRLAILRILEAAFYAELDAVTLRVAR